MSSCDIFRLTLHPTQPLLVGYNTLQLEIRNLSAQAYEHLVVTLRGSAGLSLRPTKLQIVALPAHANRTVPLEVYASQAGQHSLVVRRLSAPGLFHRFKPVTFTLEIIAPHPPLRSTR